MYWKKSVKPPICSSGTAPQVYLTQLCTKSFWNLGPGTLYFGLNQIDSITIDVNVKYVHSLCSCTLTSQVST